MRCLIQVSQRKYLYSFTLDLEAPGLSSHASGNRPPQCVSPFLFSLLPLNSPIHTPMFPGKPVFAVPAPLLSGFFRGGQSSRKGEPVKNEWVSEKNGPEWIAGPRYIRHYYRGSDQIRESKPLQDYREGKWCKDPAPIPYGYKAKRTYRSQALLYRQRYTADRIDDFVEFRDSDNLHHDMRFVERPEYNPLNNEATSSLRARFDVTYIFEVNNQGRVERRVEEYGLIFVLYIDPHDPRSRGAHEVGGGQQVVAGPVNG